MASKNFIANLDPKQPIFVGMDVHKKKWSICIIHQDEIIEKHTIPGEYYALKQILKKYENHTIFSAYEAGFLGFYLHYYLTEDNIHNIVIASNKIPVESGNLVKNDRRDAKKIAFSLSKGLIKGINIPSKELINLRQLSRTREKLVRSKRSAINRIKMSLLQHDIKIDQRRVPQHILNNISKLDIPEFVKLSVQVYLEEKEFLDKKIKELQLLAEKMAKESSYAKNYEILTSIPGIGPVIACSLCFEIGDFKRFSTSSKLASFLGLTPREYSSGEHVYRGRITGQGKPWLRAFIVEASWYTVSKDPALKEFFNRVKSNTGSGKKAIVAVARKLVHRMHSIVVNQNYYTIGEIA